MERERVKGVALEKEEREDGTPARAVSTVNFMGIATDADSWVTGRCSVKEEEKEV